MRYALLLLLQGVWGLKGINFKLPKWVGGVGGKAKK
jgi:hypothetical protein